MAATPSSSPSTSRRSISRRCAGESRPVRREARGQLSRHPGGRRCEPADQLGSLAALREAERAQAALDEAGHQPRRFAERARAQSELGVGQRRVPQRDRALGSWRAVIVDDLGLDAGDLRQLSRVGDRGRGEQQLRLGSVDPRDAAQAAEDVADVRAEDAAVDVRLVDDDVAQVGEHVAPAVVMGEHADVEHVRVGQDDVGRFADLPAPLARRVAVVDRRADARHAEPGDAAQLVRASALVG